MPIGRAAHAAAYYNRQLFVCGGYTANGAEATCVRNENVLNIETRWDNVASMPTSLVFFALVPLNDQLLAMGGNGGKTRDGALDANEDRDTVYAYNMSDT